MKDVATRQVISGLDQLELASAEIANMMQRLICSSAMSEISGSMPTGVYLAGGMAESVVWIWLINKVVDVELLFSRKDFSTTQFAGVYETARVWQYGLFITAPPYLQMFPALLNCNSFPTSFSLFLTIIQHSFVIYSTLDRYILKRLLYPVSYQQEDRSKPNLIGFLKKVLTTVQVPTEEKGGGGLIGLIRRGSSYLKRKEAEEEQKKQEEERKEDLELARTMFAAARRESYYGHRIE
ncbi:hypothetical protein ACTXT7_015671 [Hymenolepis weldensis]